MGSAYAKNIGDIVEGIKKGQYVIPEVQRSFVWDNQKVLELCESIHKGFPIGSLTVWKIPPEFREDTTFSDIVEPLDNRYRNLKNAEYLVIDGLQRLLSIFLLYEGEIELPDGSKRKSTICYNPKEDKLARIQNPKKSLK